jgi:ABC-type nickel/cobalt efflux system permease component RcnA
MKQRVYTPNTKGIIPIMAIVYVTVLIAGTMLNIFNNDSLENWFSFLQISLLYILSCSLIYMAIRSQRIIVDQNKLILKQLGLTRHRIELQHIEQVRKGKLNGSPIMEIETRKKGFKKISPLPFLPFENDWKHILHHLQEECGEEVIGEMTLKRANGELRTWKE